MPGSYVSNGQQYAQPADLYAVISQAALTHPSTGTSAQNAQLLRASEQIDGYLRQQFVLPLVSWGADIVRATCDIAAYWLVCLRGFNPEKDGQYKDNYDSAIKWCRDVSEGIISPDVVDGSPGATPGEQAQVTAPVAYSPQPVNSSGGTTRGTGSR